MPELSRAEEEAGYEIQVVQEALAPLLWHRPDLGGGGPVPLGSARRCQLCGLYPRSAPVAPVRRPVLIPGQRGPGGEWPGKLPAYLPGRRPERREPERSTGAAAAAEEVYRSFVHDQYAAVPDRAARCPGAPAGGNRRAWRFSRRRSPRSTGRRLETARRVAAVLAARASYSINVPAMEPGEDFVEQLSGGGAGLLRSTSPPPGRCCCGWRGISARYVSGFAAYLTRNRPDGGGGFRRPRLGGDLPGWLRLVSGWR